MLVSLSDPGVVPPRSIKKGFAKYPEAAKSKKLEGVVTIDVLVSETGKVLDTRVSKSANAILDQAALEAVRLWTFEPAKKNGIPVKVWLPVSMSFKAGR